MNTDHLYLAHHGIKGMKWGVRRFQNEDGSLTPAGRERYGVDVEGAQQRISAAKAEYKQAKREYNKSSMYGMTIASEAATKRLNSKQSLYNLAKQDVSSEKVKVKLNKETKKSDRRLALEQHYLDKGMTKEEAAVAAYKRERAEKIAAVAAVTTVAAATAYVAYRHYDDVTDRVLSKGDLLSRVAEDNVAAVRDGFYASDTTKDTYKYIGTLGIRAQVNGNVPYQKILSVNDDIKVASRQSGTRALQDLIKKDPSFKAELEKSLLSSGGVMQPGKVGNTYMKALDSLQRGEVNSSVYDALNINAVTHDTVTNRFQQHLKSLGYGAMQDINDRRYSGYMAKSATIVFDSSSVSVQSVKRLGADVVERNYNRFMGVQVAKTVGSISARMGAAAVGVNAVGNAATSKHHDRIVSEYRSEHPNTELSYNEILRRYYSEE